MPQGDPAGYLPNVRKARKRKKMPKKAKAKHDMMDFGQSRKAMRRKAFMGG